MIFLNTFRRGCNRYRGDTPLGVGEMLPQLEMLSPLEMLPQVNITPGFINIYLEMLPQVTVVR